MSKVTTNNKKTKVPKYMTDDMYIFWIPDKYLFALGDNLKLSTWVTQMLGKHWGITYKDSEIIEAIKKIDKLENLDKIPESVYEIFEVQWGLIKRPGLCDTSSLTPSEIEKFYYRSTKSLKHKYKQKEAYGYTIGYLIIDKKCTLQCRH